MTTDHGKVASSPIEMMWRDVLVHEHGSKLAIRPINYGRARWQAEAIAILIIQVGT
jgi:hypothetical protein